jgi:hypothetical protein
VPRRDCSGRSGDRTRGHHHAARSRAQQEKDVLREGATEAAARLDRRAHDDELGAALLGDTRDLLAEQAGARPDELPPHADAVRARHRGRGVEPPAQRRQLAVEARLERQLPLDDERSDEDDPCAAIRGKPAREVEGVLRLLPLEEGDDDRPIGDRPRPAREAARLAVERADIREPHRRSG